MPVTTRLSAAMLPAICGCAVGLLGAAWAARQPGPPAPPLAAAVAPLDRAAAAREHARQHAARLSRIAAQPRDEAWATTASSALARELGAVGVARGFAVEAVDCHLDACAATVTWPSYHRAVETYAEILGARFSVNCRREVLLAEPATPAATYRTTVVLDGCVRAKP
jgi:hypothetical protein